MFLFTITLILTIVFVLLVVILGITAGKPSLEKHKNIAVGLLVYTFAHININFYYLFTSDKTNMIGQLL